VKITRSVALARAIAVTLKQPADCKMVIVTLRQCCTVPYRAALGLVGLVVPVALVGLVGLTACDTVVYGCASSCIGAAYATFDLACSPNDLESVVATGPCAMPEAGLSYYTGTESEFLAVVGSPEAGVCHVALQFATGFSYETDVTFAPQADPTPKGCAPCPSFIGPTAGPWTVNNPSDTCVALPAVSADAGAEADASIDAGGVTGE